MTDVITAAMPPGWLVAWVLTVAVHGTVILGAAWIVTRLRPLRREARREVLWKLAALAPLATASWAVALGDAGPFRGATVFLLQESPRVAPAPPPATSPLADASAPFITPSEDVQSPFMHPSTPVGLTASPPETGPMQAGDSWIPSVLVTASLALSLLLAGKRLRDHRGLGRFLASRKPVVGGEATRTLPALAEALGVRRRVRLSVLRGIGSPMAWGILRPEICLPAAVMDQLTPEQRTAVIAHEVGHLRRRDPLWLSAFSLLEVLFPWQPLLRTAKADFRLAAEVQCDAYAARVSSPLAVAECLVRVAEWVAQPRRSQPGGAWALGARGGLLKHRVDHLLSLDSLQPMESSLARFWVTGSLVVVALAVTLPGFSVLEGLDGSPGAPTASPSLSLPSPDAPPRDDSREALVRALDREWTLLLEEVAALDRDLAGAIDPELLALRRALDARLRSFDARRVRMMTFVLGSSDPARASSDTSTPEGGNR